MPDTIVYVDWKNGNDSSCDWGKHSVPCKTLGRASELTPPGGSIITGPGIYNISQIKLNAVSLLCKLPGSTLSKHFENSDTPVGNHYEGNVSYVYDTPCKLACTSSVGLFVDTSRPNACVGNSSMESACSKMVINGFDINDCINAVYVEANFSNPIPLLISSNVIRHSEVDDIRISSGPEAIITISRLSSQREGSTGRVVSVRQSDDDHHQPPDQSAALKISGLGVGVSGPRVTHEGVLGIENRYGAIDCEIDNLYVHSEYSSGSNIAVFNTGTLTTTRVVMENSVFNSTFLESLLNNTIAWRTEDRSLMLYGDSGLINLEVINVTFVAANTLKETANGGAVLLSLGAEALNIKATFTDVSILGAHVGHPNAEFVKAGGAIALVTSGHSSVTTLLRGIRFRDTEVGLGQGAALSVDSSDESYADVIISAATVSISLVYNSNHIGGGAFAFHATGRANVQIDGNGVEYTACFAPKGAAVSAVAEHYSAIEIRLTDCTMRYNLAVSTAGGGLLLRSTDSSIINAFLRSTDFRRNVALQTGGAIALEALTFNNPASDVFLGYARIYLVIVDCSFTGNEANIEGGGILSKTLGHSQVQMTIKSTVFRNNFALHGGAIVMIHHGFQDFEDIDNRASHRLSLVNVSFVENRATGGGGGAVLLQRTGGVAMSISTKSCQWIANSSPQGRGGAIYLHDQMTDSIVLQLSLADAYFPIVLSSFGDTSLNSYAASGGFLATNAHLHPPLIRGLHPRIFDIRLSNIFVGEGNASQEGGGLQLCCNVKINISSAIFKELSAPRGGAVLVKGNVSLMMHLVTFMENQAIGSQGALYISTPGLKGYGESYVINSNFSNNLGGAVALATSQNDENCTKDPVRCLVDDLDDKENDTFKQINLTGCLFANNSFLVDVLGKKEQSDVHLSGGKLSDVHIQPLDNIRFHTLPVKVRPAIIHQNCCVEAPDMPMDPWRLTLFDARNQSVRRPIAGESVVMRAKLENRHSIHPRVELKGNALVVPLDGSSGEAVFEGLSIRSPPHSSVNLTFLVEPNNIGVEALVVNVNIRDCPQGFQLNHFKRLCEPCPLGQVSALGRPNECIKCSPGYIPNEDSTDCKPCPVSKYKTSEISCDTCGRSSYSEREGSDECEDCPVKGAECSNGRLQLKDGFYFDIDWNSFPGKLPTATTKVWSCFVQEACIAVVKQPNRHLVAPAANSTKDSSYLRSIKHRVEIECGDGYSGALCGGCKSGYFSRPGAVCTLCPNRIAVVAVFAGIIIWIVCVDIAGANFLLASSSEGNLYRFELTKTLLKTFTTHYTTLALLGSLEAGGTNESQSVFQPLLDMSMINLSSAATLRCLFNLSFRGRYWISLLQVPVYLILVTGTGCLFVATGYRSLRSGRNLCCCFGASCRRLAKASDPILANNVENLGRKNESFDQPMQRKAPPNEDAAQIELVTYKVSLRQTVAGFFKNKVFVPSIIFILLSVYGQVAESSVSAWRCTGYTVHGSTWLISDMTLSCDTQEIQTIQFVSAAVFSLFVIGFPCAYLLSMWKHKPTNTDHRSVWEYMFIGYDLGRGYWYWEALVMLRKACLAGVTTISDSTLQTLAAMSVLVVSLQAQNSCLPFKATDGNALEVLSLSILIATLILNVAAEHVQSDAYHGNSSTVGFTIALVFLNIVFGLIMAWRMTRSFRKENMNSGNDIMGNIKRKVPSYIKKLISTSRNRDIFHDGTVNFANPIQDTADNSDSKPSETLKVVEMVSLSFQESTTRVEASSEITQTGDHADGESQDSL